MSLIRERIIQEWWADQALHGAVAAFVPSTITGLKLWLKADAGTFTDSAMTIPATSDADPVGGWQDQSGNGKHVVQATSTKRGTLKTGANGQNNRAVVRGDGVDDTLISASLPSALTDNYTLFIASKGRNNGILSYQFLNGAESGWGYAIQTGTPTRNAIYPASATLVDGAYVQGTFEIATLKRASGTSTLGVNGASQSLTNSTAAPTTPITSASVMSRTSQYADCDIAEILLYDAALTAAQITQVETYLNTRWAAF